MIYFQNLTDICVLLISRKNQYLIPVEMMEPIIVTRLLEVPASKVWSALSQESELKKWYFPVQNYVFEEGKTFTFYESDDSHLFLHRCKFLTIIPGRLIEYTWEHPEHSKGSSVIKWEIEQKDNQILVTLTHSGVENFADAGPDFSRQNYEMGWNAIVRTTLRNYLYGIERLVFEMDIKTIPSLLWQKLWHDGNYSRWTEPFCEGSYLEGRLAFGERVHFMAPSGEGLYSDVTYFKENELIVFSHKGNVKDKIELPIDDETEKWTGSFEMYRLTPKEGYTRLKVEVDTLKDAVDYMKIKFPQALQRLKELAETE